MKIRATFFLLAAASLPSSQGITVNIDYSFDTNSFFGSAGSPQRLAFEAAVSVFQTAIHQDLNAITPGTVYNAGTPSEFSDTWTQSFFHPGISGTTATVTDATMAADEITIYAGGHDLSGGTLGQAGRGGGSAFGITSFLTSTSRGDSATNFRLWGGAATFDSIGTNWHFDHTTSPAAGTFDFYSVALHEVGHIFGLSSTSDAWNDHWIAGEDTIADSMEGTVGQFSGTHTVNAYNDANGLNAAFVPTLNAMLDDPATGGTDEEDLTNRHFDEGIMGFIVGTTILQEAAMDPNIGPGVRKELTTVDLGALQDIGWTIIPEPSTASLLGLGFLLGIRRRR